MPNFVKGDRVNWHRERGDSLPGTYICRLAENIHRIELDQPNVHHYGITPVFEHTIELLNDSSAICEDWS